MLEGIIKGKVILTNKAGIIKSLFNPYTELVLEDFSDPSLISEKILDITYNYDKYYNNAQILRNQHLETHNQEFFCKQVIKFLSSIK